MHTFETHAEDVNPHKMHLGVYGKNSVSEAQWELGSPYVLFVGEYQRMPRV